MGGDDSLPQDGRRPKREQTTARPLHDDVRGSTKTRIVIYGATGWKINVERGAGGAYNRLLASLSRRKFPHPVHAASLVAEDVGLLQMRSAPLARRRDG
jgi:hypothetical protein